MKDSLLIDGDLPKKFWAEAMKTANYFWNHLPTKIESYGKLISEKK